MHVGEIMLALHGLSPGVKAALDFYQPLLEKDVWAAVDELLDYPRLATQSRPENSSSYSPVRRMVALRSMTMMPALASAETVALPNSATASPVPPPSSPQQSAKNSNMACINCGKHTSGYPHTWLRYDPRLAFVWCQSCYRPRTVTAHQLKKRWGITDAQMDQFESITHRRTHADSSTEYLWAQVMASQSNARLLAASRKRNAEEAFTDDDTATALETADLLPPATAQNPIVVRCSGRR
jgi:hypothetical protein